MEREYHTIETPIEKDKIKLKSWLTGRENRNITAILLDDVTYDDKEKPKFTSIAMTKSQDATIFEVVVSINDEEKNIVDQVLNLKSEDFDFIMEEINKIVNRGKEIKKE